MVNALLWEIGRSHVSSLSYLISHSKLSARLFPPSSVARLSFFQGPQGSDIITVYFNLHHRHLRNDKSRWTSIKSFFFYSIFFLLFSVTSRVSFVIISYMYICIIVHHLLSLSYFLNFSWAQFAVCNVLSFVVAWYAGSWPSEQCTAVSTARSRDRPTIRWAK